MLWWRSFEKWKAFWPAASDLKSMTSYDPTFAPVEFQRNPLYKELQNKEGASSVAKTTYKYANSLAQVITPMSFPTPLVSW